MNFNKMAPSPCLKLNTTIKKIAIMAFSVQVGKCQSRKKKSVKATETSFERYHYLKNLSEPRSNIFFYESKLVNFIIF
jgi:hypothetical protein